MASVYKSLSKTNGHKDEESVNGVKKNKQKVLILSSRGITYRYAFRSFGPREEKIGRMN
jgi:ribosome biogenesis protein BRX1